MKLIVGLGNPGTEFSRTRHNIGFSILDEYAKIHQFCYTNRKFNGIYSEVFIDNEKVIFLKPLSYMNLSGEVVAPFVAYYKIALSDILIIHDDLDLPLGQIRLRSHGSSGGHNGLKSIELHLKTQEYKRLKIGISHDASLDTKDFVLGKFSPEDQIILEKTNKTAIEIIDRFLQGTPFSDLMSQYNGKIGE